MGALTIGRVGLDLDLDHPARWQESRGIEEREFVVSGFLKSSSVTNTKVIRSELLEQQGQLVAVTYTLDDHFDGFYILGDARIETVISSYLYSGLFPFEVNLFRIGGESRVEFQSNVTGTVLTNDHGLISTEVKPQISPPVGATAFDWEATGATYFTRGTEDGTIDCYVSFGDFSEDASWGCAPADYYKAAAELWVGNPLRLRSGLDVANDPENWEVTNGIVRVGPESGNTGRIEVECYVSGWESLKDWAFEFGGTKLTSFDYFTVSRNSPECVIVRLVVGDGSFSRHVVDLQLRRGQPFVIGAWTTTLAADTMKVVRDTTEAATAFTPTGASSAVGVHATSDDGDGNRYLIMTPQAHTADTTEGGVSVASTQQIRFAVGHELGGSGGGAFDDVSEVALHYFGYFGERVRAVWR